MPNLNWLIRRVMKSVYLLAERADLENSDGYRFYMENGYWPGDFPPEVYDIPELMIDLGVHDSLVDFHTEMIKDVLKNLMKTRFPMFVAIDLRHFLDHGRHAHESIADRSYLDYPLFPEDANGDYKTLRNVIEVVCVLFDYCFSPEESANQFNLMLFGKTGTRENTIEQCLERMRHKNPDLFVWHFTLHCRKFEFDRIPSLKYVKKHVDYVDMNDEQITV